MIRTEVFYKVDKAGKFHLVKENTLKALVHWAEWEDVTVKRWRIVLEGKREFDVPNHQKERNLWKYLLIDTSLKEKQDPLQKIFDFIPGVIPKALIRKLLDEVYLGNKDIDELNKQCRQVFSKDGSLEKAHPMMEMALSCMNLKERYNLSMTTSFEEMPYKVYSAFKIISNNYIEIRNQEDQADQLRNKARQFAGIR